MPARLARSQIRRFLRSDHQDVVVSRSIYGTIVVTALLISLEGYEDNPFRIVVTILGTMLVISMAEVYANTVGHRFEKRRHLNVEELTERVVEGVSTLLASQVPVVLFLLAGFHVISLDAAFSSARVLAICLLGFYGFAFGRLTGRPMLNSLAIGGVDALFGLALIFLKSIFH